MSIMQLALQQVFSSQPKGKPCSVLMERAPTERALPAELLWTQFSQHTDRHIALKRAAKAFYFAAKHQLVKHLSELWTFRAL